MNKANDSKFVTRNWNIANDNSNANYGIGNEINYHTDVWKYNLCNYNNGFILVRGDITITAAPETQIAFTNFVPFTKFITKIDGIAIDHAEDLDSVIPMYNLIEYSSNYSKTTGILWFYSKDETTNFNANIEKTNNSKSLKYKVKLIGNAAIDGANGILKNETIAVSLKCFTNFWWSLEMPLINYKLKLKLKKTKYYVLSVNGNEMIIITIMMLTILFLLSKAPNYMFL